MRTGWSQSIYSWPWISTIERNDAILQFLLLFFLIIKISWVLYSSPSTCANLSMYFILCDGNAATSLPRNPTVQSSVPSLMLTVLTVSEIHYQTSKESTCSQATTQAFGFPLGNLQEKQRLLAFHTLYSILAWCWSTGIAFYDRWLCVLVAPRQWNSIWCW